MPLPAKNPDQLVPSKHTNAKSSILPAAVDRVGTVPPAHFTDAGQVTVREPVPSCTSSNANEQPATAVGKVSVQFAVSVIRCIVADVTSGRVSVEPEAALTLMSSRGTRSARTAGMILRGSSLTRTLPAAR